MADATLSEMPPSGQPLPNSPAILNLPDAVRDTTELLALAADASSEISAIRTDASSHNASFSSTPPTILTDAASIASDSSKPDLTTINATLASLDQSEPPEHIEQTVEVGTPHRDLPAPQPTAAEGAANVTPKRARAARSTTRTPVYNLAKLAGTDIHGKRRANGDEVRGKRRRTTPARDIAADSVAHAAGFSESVSPKSARGAAKTGSIKGKGKGKALAVATRRATRASGVLPVENPVTLISSLGKRSRKSTEPVRVPRELRRLQDTNEFVGIEAKPVLHTIWSNGKYIDPNELDESGEPVHKKARRSVARKEEPEPQEEIPEEAAPAVQAPTKRVKKWLTKGLYAGQDAPADFTSGLSTADKKKLAQLPELRTRGKPNKVLPLPMFAGLRTLINGRDFKLPFDVCNPLPPGQPKPDEWRKMTKSKWELTLWRAFDILTYPQTASSEMLGLTGARPITSRTINRSASVSLTMDAPRTARTASCCMSATTPTAMLARTTARTAHFRI